MDRTSAETRRGPTMEMLRRVTSNLEGVRLADPIDVFCTPKTCRPHEGRTLYYFDSNHMSPAGAERFNRLLEKEFNWAFTGDDGGMHSNRAAH